MWWGKKVKEKSKLRKRGQEREKGHRPRQLVMSMNVIWLNFSQGSCGKRYHWYLGKELQVGMMYWLLREKRWGGHCCYGIGFVKIGAVSHLAISRALTKADAMATGFLSIEPCRSHELCAVPWQRVFCQQPCHSHELCAVPWHWNPPLHAPC